MKKYILLIAFLALAVINGFSQITNTDSDNRVINSNSGFARFDHTENGRDFYWLQLNKFGTEYERAYFYELSSSKGIFITDKNKYDADSTLFSVKAETKPSIEAKFNQLFDLVLRTNESIDEVSRINYLNEFPFHKFNNIFSDTNHNGDSPLANPDCSTAEVSCSGNTYSFPSGTSGSATSSGGYPNFGCLGSTPCPAWFYMQVGVAGDINIHISQATPGDPSIPRDVDFICWGPFNSLTDGCNSGLTAGNIVDCSYSGNAEEDCFIPNAQVGEIYILLMTNFSQQPAQITFAQSGGTGVTNCDIVYNCGIISIAANPTACSAATNTYSISGNIEFTNPPATGTLTITDITNIPNVSQTFTAPFNSPQAYTLSNLTCNGASHTITASFSAEADCNITDTYNAPTSICPVAAISGGGAICNNGTSTANVLIDLMGLGPFDFTYALNSVPQPPVTNYNGPVPFVLTTSTPGTYSLVSVSNAACPGTVSGSVSVILDPLPVPVISGSTNICAGTINSGYSTQTGKQNYIWTVSAGGSIASGQGTSTVSINWNTPGPQTVSVTYLGPPPSNCAPLTPTVYNVNVAAIPAANAGADVTVCQGQAHTVSGATVANEASYSWQIISGLGTLTNAGTLSPTYTPTAAETGDVVLSLNVTGLSTCSPVADQVTIHILPMVTASAGPDKSVCQNSTFTVTSAVADYYSSVSWTTTGTGTLIDAGTLSPTYQPGAGETGPVVFTLTGIGNAPCGSVTSQFTLTVNPPATANAGPPEVICQGSTFTIAASMADNASSLLWTRSGTGTFDNATILHPTYTPSAADILAGNVTLTLTATGLSACAPANGSVILGISKQVLVDAGPDGMVCQNAAFPITAASEQHSTAVSWTHNGTGILSGAGTISPSYLPGPGESGVVTLTLTGAPISPCGAVTDQMQITVHPLPVANAGIPSSICQGNNFSVSDATAQFYSSVSWTENGPGSLVNANTLTPTYIPLPAETGTVTLTLTAQGINTCSAETAVSTRTLTINPLPDVNAGTDATICAANTFTVSGVQQFTSTLQWTTAGDGAFANPGLLSTTYTPGASDILTGSVLLTLTGGGSGACSAVNDVDQLTLTIDPMPAINAGPDGAFCVTNPIALTGTSATHYSSLQWISSGDGVYNNSSIVSPTYAPGNVDFNNGTVTLTMKAFGLLSCAAQSISDSRVLSVSPYPIINAGPDDYICSNITQYQFNGIGNNYNLGNIQWTFTGGDGFLSNPNSINPTYFAGPVDLTTVNRNITFTLTVQGIGNCNSVFINDQVVLKIDPTPVSNSGPDDENCGRNPYQLSATAQYQTIINWITSGDGTFSNPGILNPTYTPGPGDVGNTVVLTLDLSGCKSITGADFLWLTVHPDPGATMHGTTSICEGSTTPVSVDLTGTPPWSLTYTNGTSPVTVNNIITTPYLFDVNPSLTTNWWLTSANDAFCTAPVDSLKGLVTVTVFPLPDVFTATVSNNGVFCEGTPGVSVGLNGSQVGMNYELWQNGLNTGAVRAGTGNPLNFGIVNIPGQYSIRGINPAGNCMAYMNDTLNVIMNPIPVTDFTASVPCFGDTTTFTVSGDYINSTSNWHWSFGDGKTFISDAGYIQCCTQCRRY